MRVLNTIFLLTVLATCIGGCTQERIANRGFSLPVGDAERGRELFKYHNCSGCHALAAGSLDGGNDKNLIVLGGTVTRVQTYGDLVSSIINPTHRLAEGYPLEQITKNGRSKMAYYNQVLTVEELIDLVTFLKSQYLLKSYSETIYPFFVYPG